MFDATKEEIEKMKKIKETGKCDTNCRQCPIEMDCEFSPIPLSQIATTWLEQHKESTK